MSDEVLVQAEGVSKKFCRSLKRSMWYGAQDVAAELMGRTGNHDQLRKNEFWAVDDVSFQLRRGECLGLIGPNGAGKSTLLKMLNGLIKPDKGRITIRGRVGALIELGAGFNPILTARENIYVNGSVLGFSKKEIDRKFDEIVDFAELEEFIDMPVQSFSSGMKVRLGFAVAAQMEPDVLLIDEVLAVGDASFVTKCMNAIDKLSRRSAIIVVSHSMPMISRICSSVLCSKRGHVEYFGCDVVRGIETYLKGQAPTDAEIYAAEIDLTSVNVFGSNGRQVEGNIFEYNAGFMLFMRFRTYRTLPKCYINVGFTDALNRSVAQCFSALSSFVLDYKNEEFWVKLSLESLSLNPGKYSIAVDLVEALAGDRRGEIVYKNTSAASLIITGTLTGWAPVQFTGNWQSGVELETRFSEPA